MTQQTGIVMLTITVGAHRDRMQLTLDGHADFGPRGTDIVCAAASAIVETALLGRERQSCSYPENVSFVDHRESDTSGKERLLDRRAGPKMAEESLRGHRLTKDNEPALKLISPYAYDADNEAYKIAGPTIRTASLPSRSSKAPRSTCHYRAAMGDETSQLSSAFASFTADIK